jgi:hypothetical protein
MMNTRGQQIEEPFPSVPLYIKLGSDMHKPYITLFTCATTRAMHLEFCFDMSTDKSLMALQRFFSRRVLHNTIYTDNERTFHAAKFELPDLWEELFPSRLISFSTIME